MKYFYVETYSDYGDENFYVYVENEVDIPAAIDKYFDGQYPEGFKIHKTYGPKVLAAGEVKAAL